MASFMAYAPAKVILFGEHFVVYGAPGLVAAIRPENEIRVEGVEADGASAGFEYESTIKKNNIVMDFLPSPSFSPTHPYAALYLKLAAEFPSLCKLRIRSRVKKAWPLKGVGNSASLGAALGAGLRSLGGEKHPAPSSIFEDAQTADEVAHGGRPSGIDAAAAAYGGVLEFKKDFSNPFKPKITPVKIASMRDVRFLLIDTLGPGEKHGSTGELVARFAKNNGITKKPAELDEKERERAYEPYHPLFMHALLALREGDWAALGLLMDQNHRLLQGSGVSSAGIEKAIAICKSFGALGAKMSGAGGPGGVVIALAEKKRSAAMKEALGAGGFSSYAFEIAQKGVHAKRV